MERPNLSAKPSQAPSIEDFRQAASKFCRESPDEADEITVTVRRGGQVIRYALLPAEGQAIILDPVSTSS